MRRGLTACALAIGLFTASAAQAGAVTDCPGRDAPFSADSPLIDLLLSPAAKAVLNGATDGRFDKMPAQFIGTTTPSFAAILTLKETGRFTGLTADQIGPIDTALRALPVTDADRVARCVRYDNDAPSFSLPKGKKRVLIFEKINGFYHTDAVPAARDAITALASQKGWGVVSTDRGGAINPKTLRQFDVVVWNNNSGDVLTLSQRAALKAYVEKGGGFLAIHGAGGDSATFWPWYTETLVGARFMGHPMNPQFQDADVHVDDPQHAVTRALPEQFRMTDEWYSFTANPRASGFHILMTLDEGSYAPNEAPKGQDLRMGSDHPIAWSRCVGKGRSVYSAIGHRPESYSDVHYVAFLDAALDWTGKNKKACLKNRK